MTLFRFHRGGLDESMETVQEVYSMAGLVRAIRRASGFATFEDSDVEVKPQGYDKRIGWDTHMVTIKGNAIGYTSGPLWASDRGLLFYDRSGKPMPLLEWATALEDEGVREVAYDLVGDIRVSTIWVGMPPPCAPPEDAPLIFETMVFGSELKDDIQRYATEAEAAEGHYLMVARVRKTL